LIAGVVLELSGFVSAAGGDLPPTQPPSAIAAILALAGVIPALFNIAGSLLLRKYNLREGEFTPMATAP
jgi:Na+/melibiose symporter-like transporter